MTTPGSTCARNLPQHFNGCVCSADPSITPEADVDLGGPYANTPVFDLDQVRPGTTLHVGLGPGRALATRCGEDDCNALIHADDPGALTSKKTQHLHTEHRGGIQVIHTDGKPAFAYEEVGLKVDEWVVDEDKGIRLAFTNLDEGWDGDYDETDPEDDNLLRLDVQVRREHPLADLDEPFDADADEWYLPVNGGSMCTAVRADKTTPEQLRRLTREAMSRLADDGPTNTVMDGLSRLTDIDAPAYQCDYPNAETVKAMMNGLHYDVGAAETIGWCDSHDSYQGHAVNPSNPYKTSDCLACEDRKIGV
jgi:hypothetical protein